MKTMKIEKELQFADQVKEPRSLQVRESLEYHKEAEGIRAVGPLRVQGSYVNDEGELQEYEEVLDMDVLAPVSYTHLDVYKRQVYVCRCSRIRLCEYLENTADQIRTDDGGLFL